MITKLNLFIVYLAINQMFKYEWEIIGIMNKLTIEKRIMIDYLFITVIRIMFYSNNGQHWFRTISGLKQSRGSESVSADEVCVDTKLALLLHIFVPFSLVRRRVFTWRYANIFGTLGETDSLLENIINPRRWSVRVRFNGLCKFRHKREQRQSRGLSAN